MTPTPKRSALPRLQYVQAPTHYRPITTDKVYQGDVCRVIRRDTRRVRPMPPGTPEMATGLTVP
jgi:hypothetical protein